jgi:hypothetical protein
MYDRFKDDFNEVYYPFNLKNVMYNKETLYLFYVYKHNICIAYYKKNKLIDFDLNGIQIECTFVDRSIYSYQRDKRFLQIKNDKPTPEELINQIENELKSKRKK